VSDLPTIEIDLPFRAIPKANKHKVARRGGGRNAKRSIVNDLTGALAKSEESFLTQAMDLIDDDVRETLPWKPPCAIEARITFVYVPTASWDQWKIDAAKRGSFRMVMTPDLENVVKFVLDAAECNKKKADGLGFYTDDKLIFRQVVEKRYGLEERVILTLIKHPQATAKTWKELPCD
jgi:Holliday junction resolvase RusA-like endonuclease